MHDIHLINMMRTLNVYSIIVALMLIDRYSSFQLHHNVYKVTRHHHHQNIDPSNVHTIASRKHATGLPMCSSNNDNDTNNSSDVKYFLSSIVTKLTSVQLSTFSSIAIGTILGTIMTVLLILSPLLGMDDNLDAMISSSSASTSSSSSPSSSSSKRSSKIESIIPSIQLFENILYDLKTGYVDDINANKLFETAVSAMLSSLDPYTEFENLGAAKSMQESVQGSYGGVGMVISNSKPFPAADKLPSSSPVSVDDSVLGSSSSKGVTVVDAFEGYAYNAGVRAGDRILSIDGADVTKMPVNSVRNLLRGEPGTPIVLKLLRDDNEVTVTMDRNQVHLSDVKLATFVDDGIGYINLSGFNAGAGRDFRSAFYTLRYSTPNDLKGLILDLRGNPGGLLDAAVEIASYLVPSKSEIVSAKSKSDPEILYRSGSNKPIRPEGMKLVVLVNGGSASASEIVAGAIQDLDAGVIVGSSKTFGKGLVQKIVQLPYNNALKYTTAKYYTPSGRCIQAINYLGGRENSKSTDTFASATDGDNDGEVFNGQGNGILTQSSVKDNDRKVFLTKAGRQVRDGGGIEPDVIVPGTKPSVSQKIFITQQTYFDFASEFLKTNEKLRPLLQDLASKEISTRDSDLSYLAAKTTNPALQQFIVIPSPTALSTTSTPTAPTTSTSPITNSPASSSNSNDQVFAGEITNNRFPISTNFIFNRFKDYVVEKVKTHEMDLESILKPQLDVLTTELTDLGLSDVTKEVDILRTKVRNKILLDMDINKNAIVEDLKFTLLSRELPDRVMIYKNIVTDPQVKYSVNLINNAINNDIKGSNSIDLGRSAELVLDSSSSSKSSDSDSTRSSVNEDSLYNKLLQGPNN